MVRYRRITSNLELYEIDIINANDNDLLTISQELGLGLNLNEMKYIKKYFTSIGRNPTDAELQTIAQTWSEHCYHKTFKGKIVTDGEVIENMLKNYIVKATRELNYPWLISVFEDNAGIVEFDDEYAIAVKVETHNHPSAVEPFGGAATGIGGVIRDVLGVWAEPIANIDVLCFGPLNWPYEKLLPGLKHPRYIYNGVIAGIAHYGNNMGIPTVAGAIIFDEGYVGNVVVYCGCVGILPKSKYFRRVKPGDLILLIGGRTGRDGLHGVIFASAELEEETERYRPAVQIPNPIEEEKLRRAILRIRDEELGDGITDLGGGGLSCAVSEMAYKYNCGAVVWLDKVPLKDPTLAPWEIWLSESQERMLLAIPEDKVNKVFEILDEEEIEGTVIGKFVNTGRIVVYYRDLEVVNLETKFLFNPPTVERIAKPVSYSVKEVNFEEPKDLNEILLKLLSSPNIASKEEVIRIYDHEVKGLTVIKPLQGMIGGPNDAVILKPLPKSWRGIVISVGIKPRYGKLSTYWMAASSIEEAIRNNVSVGGRRIALLDNFTWGNPEKPDRMWGLLEAVKACYEYAKYFETPFISGKDSLYNESPLGPVTSTLLITAIGIIPDIRKAVTLDVKNANNYIVILGLTRRELGASEYYRLLGYLEGEVPKIDKNIAKKVVDSVVKAIDLGYIKACHDLSEGGLAVALAEMAFSGGYGIEVWLDRVPRTSDVNRNDYILFSESNSRFVLEIDERYLDDFLELVKDIPHAVIGKVVKEPRLIIHGLDDRVIIDSSLNELLKAWKGMNFNDFFKY